MLMLFAVPDKQPVTEDKCNKLICGLNADCREQNGAASCFCPPNYLGDPYVSCRPECVLNSDCPRDKSCARNRCTDPCANACGSNAKCRVINHNPVCTCEDGFEGDAYSSCVPKTPVVIEEIKRVDVCNPSPCGSNAECLAQNGLAVCVCIHGQRGDPYVSCRPECASNAECNNNLACIGQKCRDPCPGTCGIQAKCQVIGHNPICSCPVGYSGDPRVQCKIDRIPVFPKPECEVDRDCPSNKACVEQRCRDPCTERVGICAPNAICQVIAHRPVCGCPEGYTGNPQFQCIIGN